MTDKERIKDLEERLKKIEEWIGKELQWEVVARYIATEKGRQQRKDIPGTPPT